MTIGDGVGYVEDAAQQEQAHAPQTSLVETVPVVRAHCRDFTGHELRLRALSGFEDWKPARRQLSEIETRGRELAGLPPQMLFEEEQ